MQKSVIPKQQQYRLELVDAWWHWVSRRRFRLVPGVTGSEDGGTGLYMMVLGQYGVILVDTQWYWNSRG